jgi:hypothetical protein
MKRPLILAAALALAVAPSFAETSADVETVPIERPVATYTRPSGWSSYPDDNGVTTISADGKVSVSTILVTADDLGAAEKFASSWYAQRRVRLDLASRQTPPHRSIGHFETTALKFAGSDFDGPAEISTTLVKLGAKHKFLMICVIGPPLAMQKIRADVEAIMNSIRMTKLAN